MSFMRSGMLIYALVFAIAVAVVALAHQPSSPTPARAAGEAMAVDCNASSPGTVDADCTYDVGESFQISVHTIDAGSGYAAYQVKPRWTDAVLDYLPNATIANENQWPGCALPARFDNQPGDPSVLYGCSSAFPPTTSTYTGVLAVFEMSCEAAGSTALTLVPRAGDTQGGTQFSDDLGVTIDAALTNANVTCSASGGPTNTPTPTPSPITPTPTSCVLRVAPAGQSLTTGNSGAFDVEVSQCEDVAGVEFLLNFDEAIISVDSGPGTPSFPTGCGVQVQTINNGSGVLDFGCITAPLAGDDGGGVVAHYGMTCLSAGTSSLDLASSELVNGNPAIIPHGEEDGSITCLSPGASPTSTATSTPTNTPVDATPTTPTATTPTATGTPQMTPELTQTPTTTTGELGDVNCNGRVDSIDAALVLQLDAALLDRLACQDLADLNSDGVIDSLDALYILWIAAGLV